MSIQTDTDKHVYMVQKNKHAYLGRLLYAQTMLQFILDGIDTLDHSISLRQLMHLDGRAKQIRYQLSTSNIVNLNKIPTKFALRAPSVVYTLCQLAGK